MYLTAKVQPYIAFSEDSVLDVLKKISSNKARVIFIVSEHAVLLGSVSDGDVRRWLTESERIDLNVSIAEIMNHQCKRVVGIDKPLIAATFSGGIDCIPIVDEVGHLVQLAFRGSEGFFVGEREVSESAPVYVIAEIGNNHQGGIKLAKQLVLHAKEAGADCVKFQMRNMSQLYKNKGDVKDDSADLGAQYTLDLLSKFQLSNDELIEVFDFCKSENIVPLCTPWDLDSLAILDSYGMPAYKVASADFTNYELLAAVAKTGKPFFLSTGMSSEDEIKSTVEFLDRNSANYVLLHCNSTYPTPFKDVNLKYLTRLKSISGKLVGYSGHERGIEVPVASRMLGACVIEKHLTVDKGLEGNDHKVSLLPEELKTMVRMLRNVEESLGSESNPREITQGELLNRENLAKSLVAAREISAGEVITRDLVVIKSPGQGLQPNRIEELVGKTANRDIAKGGFFFESDIKGRINKRNDYDFDRPFGVPVRYHDYRQIMNGSNLDFVEFHLSYKDMEVDLSDYFSGDEPIGFAVHSPELFANDHILDLCSESEDYIAVSIAHLKSVVEITKGLKRFFPKTPKPVIVLNAGGWNYNGFIPVDERQAKYDEISKSLEAIDLDGVCIAIQTMPPFPWHFGGQSYHNLFVDPDEIAAFCKANPSIKVCLDVSHSMMACNHYGWDLLEFVEKIAEYNVHMHVVDAKGSDGEGVEIGQGDVDFHALAQVLKDRCPDIQFIPEVWQGHKNGGEGFWHALDYLDGLF